MYLVITQDRFLFYSISRGKLKAGIWRILLLVRLIKKPKSSDTINIVMINEKNLKIDKILLSRLLLVFMNSIFIK